MTRFTPKNQGQKESIKEMRKIRREITRKAKKKKLRSTAHRMLPRHLEQVQSDTSRSI